MVKLIVSCETTAGRLGATKESILQKPGDIFKEKKITN